MSLFRKIMYFEMIKNVLFIANDANNSETEKQKQKENNELLQQLKDQEEKLAQSLKDKESEVTRLALENEEHLKRVSELTAYIQQASQDREQIIQQYTSYRLVIDILEMNFRP